MALIKGDLVTAGAPELFRAIAEERRTGRLVLSRPGDGDPDGLFPEAIIYFREGEAYHARLDGTGIRLGDRLISAGLVSKEDIDQALTLQDAEGGGRRLGELLLDHGLISDEQLATIVRQQIEDTIFEILRWDGGSFIFETEVESQEDIGIEISVENLIMEGARRFREWHQITRRVPSLEAVPTFSEDGDGAVEVALTPEEWSFVSRVDGRHTVKELARACGFTDLEAGRTVFGLVTAGLLSLDLPAGMEFPEEDPEIEAAFDELERAIAESAKGGPHTLGLEQLGVLEIPEEPLEEFEVEASEGLAPVDIEEVSIPSIEEREPAAEELEEELVAEADVEPQLVEVEGEVRPEESEAPGPFPLDSVYAAQPSEPEAETETFEVEETQEGPVFIAEPEPEMTDADANGRAVTFEPTVSREPGDGIWAPPEIAPAEAERREVAAAAADELRWSVLAPALGDPKALEEPAQIHVVAEEVAAPPRSDFEPSYARMFAELSAPTKDKEPEQPPPVTEPEAEADREAEESEQPPAAEPETFTHRVDPMVDTTSLIKEFSALGLEEENGSSPGAPSYSQVQDEPETRSKGFFGRRRK